MYGGSPYSSAPYGALPEEMARDIVSVITNASNPVQEANEILRLLREGKAIGNFDSLEKNKKYAALRKWLPNTPEKLAAYATIIVVVSQSLGKAPETKIEINNFFLNQYQLIIGNPREGNIEDLIPIQKSADGSV